MYMPAETEQDRTLAVIPAIVPKTPWRVAAVNVLPGFRLWVCFNDGTSGEVAMYDLVHSPNAGIFAELRDETQFRQVRIEWGTVTWPSEIDLAPDAMHEAIQCDGKWVLA
jgi:hypothetical protein